MPEAGGAFKRAVAELRRRHVFRTAAAYLVGGWILLQVADVTFEPLGFPHWVQRALIITVAAGFLPACAMAWIFDITRHGLVRTPAATPAAPASVAPDAAPTSLPGTPTPTTPPASAIASVAVLPFADLSQAHDQDWFCDGLAEEIIDALCCVRGLRVASRTASFRFRDGSVDPREIGRLLAVDAILEGSVRKAGDRLKITAQLIDAHDGYHLWSESFERGMADVFAIQSEIAKNVAHALKMSLSGAAAGRFQRYAPANLEAYEYYLRGRQLAGQTTVTSWQHAPRMFRRAIELDPGYAQAHAGLADSLAQVLLWRYAVEGDVLPEATAAAKRALELAPDLAEAHVAQGHVHSLAGDDAGAVRAFEHAVALNPDLHEAWYYFARHCFARGDFARAAELFEEAWRTRPDEFVVLALAVNAHDANGDRARGDALAERALKGLLHQADIEPENARLQNFVGGMYLRNGRPDEGRPHVEAALKLNPDDFGTIYNSACFFSLSGDIERALDLLERFRVAGRGNRDWIAHDSDLRALHGHPRFEALLAQLR